MPRRAGEVTRNILVDAPLPQATKSYTVISHGSIVNNILKTLDENNFSLVEEVYKANDNSAQTASGIYRLNYGDDPDLGMLFAFSNSYDKSMKFRCAVGGYVHVNKASVISKTQMEFNRKHTGTSDLESREAIKQQIENSETYFAQLLQDKEAMKNTLITNRQFAELLGVLFVEKKLITGEQLKIAKNELDKPSFSYTTPSNSLWTMYNHILVGLAKSHPKTWMDQQKLVHFHLMDEFNLVEFDQESSDDSPEITGIPNGNTISDTDDNESVETKVGFVLPGFRKPDTEYHPEATEEEAHDQAKNDEVTILPGTITTFDETMKAIEAENSADEEADMIKNEEIIEEKEDNGDRMIIEQQDVFSLYPDVEMGSEIDIEGIVLTIVDVEGDSFVLKPLEKDNQPKISRITTPTDTRTDDEMLSDSAPASCKYCGEAVESVNAGDEIIDICTNCGSKEAVDEDEGEDEPVEFLEHKIEEDPKMEAIKGEITMELKSIYGVFVNYTIDTKDDQYNVTLETGETIVLLKEEIDKRAGVHI
jgi:hypothetical protein